MTYKRIVLAVGIASTLGFAAPASAQFFFQPPDMSGAPVHGDEPGLGLTLPDATPAELRAGLIWHLRAALNVAALQCQFEPTLLTLSNYNAILTDHNDELKSSFNTLTAYFLRKANKNTKAGQDALDRFGTRTYSGYSTVSAQYTFCQTAGTIGREAIFARRGSFGEIAEQRLRQMRNSLVFQGEQRFPGSPSVASGSVPTLDPRCWNKRDEFDLKKCPQG